MNSSKMKLSPSLSGILGVMAGIIGLFILFPTVLAAQESGASAGTARAAAVAPAAAQPSSAKAPETASSAAAPPAGYRLAPGDSILLSVFNEPALQAERTISSTGEASFYLIGSVKVAGKSIGDAEEAIRELYDRDYLVNPKVTLTITGYAAQYATITGAVAKPGNVAIPVEGKLDIIEAIAAAGGTSEKADLRSVVLRRKGSTETQRIDLDALQKDPANVPIIRPGDAIAIGLKTDRFINVIGEVNRPGQIRFPDQGGLDVITAVTMAGDFSRFAKTSDITIIRGGRVIQVDGAAINRGEAPSLPLLPNDTVKVGRRRI
ncbi:MAG: polysaccharide biosynthesis/export family protein [Verrucomicrobiota bacterium]|jgi:polysaccharide export outer membrane protein